GTARPTCRSRHTRECDVAETTSAADLTEGVVAVGSKVPRHLSNGLEGRMSPRALGAAPSSPLPIRPCPRAGQSRSWRELRRTNPIRVFLGLCRNLHDARIVP